MDTLTEKQITEFFNWLKEQTENGNGPFPVSIKAEKSAVISMEFLPYGERKKSAHVTLFARQD